MCDNILSEPENAASDYKNYGDFELILNNIKRRKTRAVKVGGIVIGGGAPVSVQSMSSIDSRNFAAVYEQTRELECAGCDIVRIAVPEESCVGIFEYIKSRGVSVPLVADIHFDYRLAILSAENGADKIRVNPGNLGAPERLLAVAESCLKNGCAMRVGVNGGSAEKRFVEKYGGVTSEALAESALSYVHTLDAMGFFDTVVSVKSSDVKTMIEASRLIAAGCDCPLHLGVTEAGTARMGTIKNAVGIGSLLCDGIGDTIRVTLSAPPVDEVIAGRDILSACGYADSGIELVSCPTCGRTRIDLFGILQKLEPELYALDTKGKRIKVAVMGCAVNGPGEAREADVGIAGGDGEAVLFRYGKIVRKLGEADAAETLISEVRKIIEEN